MKNKRRCFRSNQGAVMMITIFLLLVLLPVVLVLTRWLTVHRRGTTQARVHMRAYYAGEGAINNVRYTIQQAPPGCPGLNCWDPSNTFSTVYTDSGTVVSVTMTNTGTP
jgi:Tfp pilus assembly protein PilX